MTVSHGFDRHSHELEYDHLVLALGSVTNFFNLPGLAERALTMKSLGDAIQLRNRLIAHLEEADTECAQGRTSATAHFRRRGGGFAGVETIASINDFLRDALPFYPNLQEEMLRRRARASGRIHFARARRKTRTLCRQETARTRRRDSREDESRGGQPNEIELSNGERITSSTLIWTAGVSPNPALDLMPCAKERGRIKVNANLEVEGCRWLVGARRLRARSRFGDRQLLSADCAARIARRKSSRAQHHRECSRWNEETVQFQIDRSTGGDRPAHRRRANSRRSTFQDFSPGFSGAGFIGANCRALEKKIRVAIDWALDVFFSKDFVQYLDQRALAHTQTETRRRARGIDEQLSIRKNGRSQAA